MYGEQFEGTVWKAKNSVKNWGTVWRARTSLKDWESVWRNGEPFKGTVWRARNSLKDWATVWSYGEQFEGTVWRARKRLKDWGTVWRARNSLKSWGTVWRTGGTVFEVPGTVFEVPGTVPLRMASFQTLFPRLCLCINVDSHILGPGAQRVCIAFWGRLKLCFKHFAFIHPMQPGRRGQHTQRENKSRLDNRKCLKDCLFLISLRINGH